MAKSKKKAALSLEERLEQALVPEAEQPYPVPKNWNWVNLPFLCKYIRAGGDKPACFSEEKTDLTTIPVVANGISNEGIVGYTDIANEKENTITISGRGTIGFSVLRKYPYYPIIRLIVICPKENINSLYIKYIFDYFLESGTGSSIPQLTVPMLKNKGIPVPPFAEQQRIVDRIESLFAKLDEAKEKAQAALDSFETRKAAILHKAFTGELTAKWREENGVGMDSWKYKKFDNCIDRMQNGLSKRNGKEGSKYLVLRLANLSDSDFITDDMRYIILDEKEQQAYKLHINDVVMIRVNGSKENVGRQLLVRSENEWAFCDHLIRITYNENIVLPQYMVYFAKSDTYRQYIRNNMVSSAGQNTISRKGMAQLKVPLPDVSEQADIVRLLDNFFAKEQKAKELCSVLDKIDLIKKSILARAFRGELGTNDPTEESALNLLKSIV